MPAKENRCLRSAAQNERGCALSSLQLVCVGWLGVDYGAGLFVRSESVEELVFGSKFDSVELSQPMLRVERKDDREVKIVWATLVDRVRPFPIDQIDAVCVRFVDDGELLDLLPGIRGDPQCGRSVDRPGR